MLGAVGDLAKVMPEIQKTTTEMEAIRGLLERLVETETLALELVINNYSMTPEQRRRYERIKALA